MVLQQKNLKDVYRMLSVYHRRDFKELPAYSTFIDEIHRALPRCFELLTVYDAQMEHLLLNEHARLAVGDTLYGASIMRKRMWRRYRHYRSASSETEEKNDCSVAD
jgi:hypothetical protein